MSVRACVCVIQRLKTIDKGEIKVRIHCILLYTRGGSMMGKVLRLPTREARELGVEPPVGRSRASIYNTSFTVKAMFPKWIILKLSIKMVWSNTEVYIKQDVGGLMQKCYGQSLDLGNIFSNYEYYPGLTLITTKTTTRIIIILIIITSNTDHDDHLLNCV